MDLEERLSLVREVGEEIITEEDLKQLFEAKRRPVAYDGFEPSGKTHIAQGILRAINVNKMVKAGCTFKMWIADWHAWANNKMGGDFGKIQKAGDYMVEVWKASGMDTSKVKFFWASDVMGDKTYWEKVMKISINSTLNRVIRCSQIMGRKENEILSASQIFYPCMQAADIFHLGIDIAQLGMDQRKATILTKEVAPKIDGSNRVAVHHHLLLGLQGGVKMNPVEAKMSKSVPKSAIYIHDTKAEIKDKRVFLVMKRTRANKRKTDKIPETTEGNLTANSFIPNTLIEAEVTYI